MGNKICHSGVDALVAFRTNADLRSHPALHSLSPDSSLRLCIDPGIIDDSLLTLGGRFNTSVAAEGNRSGDSSALEYNMVHLSKKLHRTKK